MKFDAIALLAPRVLKLIIFVFVDALIARNLGPERFGFYAYVGALFVILVQISRYGTDDIIVRALVHRTKLDSITSIVAVRLTGGAIASVSFVAIFLVDPKLYSFGILVWIFPAGLIFASIAIMEPYLQSGGRFKKLAFFQAGVVLTVGAVKILLILTTASIAPYLILVPLEFALPALFTLGLLSKGGLKRVTEFPISAVSVTARFKEGSYLVLAAVVMMAYSRLDQLMLGNMRSLADVAIYAAAYRVPETLAILGSVVCQVVFPGLIKMRASDFRSYQAGLRGIARILFFIGITATMLSLLLSSVIILVLFGQQYSSSVSTMAILSLIVLPNFFGLFTYRWMVVEKLAHLALLRSILGILLNVILNALLIPNYGPNGAAIATVVTLWITYVATLFVLPSTRGLGFLIVSSVFFWRKS